MRLTRKFAVLVATIVAAGGAVVAAPPALAAPPLTTTAVAVCDAASATYTITWTITNAAETPLTIASVWLTPDAPISALSGIAPGSIVPPASEGPLIATSTVHSYFFSRAIIRMTLEGSPNVYGGGPSLPVCGKPVMPQIGSVSRCDAFEISAEMPANGYAVSLSIRDQPTLIVEPGMPAKKWTLPAEPGAVYVEIPGQGFVASPEWVPPRSCVSPSLGVSQLFALVNYRYVLPTNAGPGTPVDTVRADTISPIEQTKLEFLDAGDGYIAIEQPANKSLLSVVSDTEPLRWQFHDYVGDAQRFRLVTNADGSVSLRAKLNGKYVTAEKAGKQPLYANRAAIGPWEKFTRYAVGAGPAPILALVNSGFVTAESAGKKPLIANRGDAALWEFFFVEDLGNGKVALKSLVNGKYVTAESAGKKPLIANRAAVGPWETFTLVSNADQTQSLRAQVNGKYVTAEKAGAQPLIANRAAIGPWEKFNLLR
ncbi:hypothetical protein DFJ67_2531 [Asanoa ferruginea]|uniref:Ricin-type beta-trefoil lectin protein n=1 Tax=Asanoa ferruginea TaxID=53367 RepID=A0A3D9ZGL7_9ACTN|nr:hypothetical protein [Asanoa ferruginea]REF96546.1 hypothetical protein DFJ67_2531 [Asanoa ferruginea]GIF53659.1 hypothetical protein Afe04nite_81980 [Asanoa ferruginea]